MNNSRQIIQPKKKNVRKVLLKQTGKIYVSEYAKQEALELGIDLPTLSIEELNMVEKAKNYAMEESIKHFLKKKTLLTELKKSEIYTNELDLEKLGEASEIKIRQNNLVKLPNSTDFYFEKEKERYYINMYRLIVTARQEICNLKDEIEKLNYKLKSRSLVSCPSCSHKFTTDENRYLPKYIKIIHSTNCAEILFDDINHLRNWLLLNNLDSDKEGIPIFFNKKKKRKNITLADLGSNFLIES